MATTRSRSLEEAFDRTEDFLAVNGPAPTMDAVLRLQEAAGIEEAERVVIKERLSRLRSIHRQRSDQTGGLVLGLILAGFNSERD